MLSKLKQSITNPFTYVFLAGIMAANQGLYYDWVIKTAEIIQVKRDYAEFAEAHQKSYDVTMIEVRKMLAANQKNRSNLK
ncbi:MAG: hypothetical protein HC852_08165 [Acaryochloridaceae cyanobacterium RU_4_10]|nr:hypothetical protein [Acaryochloridaceae cyanobacterium RU_4_10]